MTYRPLHIKELLGHILSFIPRKDINLWALTCKSFYDAVPIIRDQKTVAELGDMFSLKKIAYSPKVIMRTACRYNNVKMVDYILRISGRKNNYVYGGIHRHIGYSGNEDLIKKVSVKYLLNECSIFSGICEGGHTILFDKYVMHCQRKIWAIIYGFKSNNNDMHNKITQHFDNFPYFELFKISGLCAIPDKNMVRQIINNIIKNNELNDEIFKYICYGLLIGNHFDIFMSLRNEKKYDLEFLLNSVDIFYNIVDNGNYEMAQYILLNYNDPRGIFFDLDFVDHCIHYRRGEILELILNYMISKNYDLENEDFEHFSSVAEKLRFYDIVDIIMKYTKK